MMLALLAAVLLTTQPTVSGLSARQNAAINRYVQDLEKLNSDPSVTVERVFLDA